MLPAGVRRTLYHIALERGFEDAVVRRCVIRPVFALLEAAQAMETRIVAMLGGGATEPQGPTDRDGGST